MSARMLDWFAAGTAIASTIAAFALLITGSPT